MIFSKTAISLFCLLLLLSVFVANVLNLITTDHNFYKEYVADSHTKKLIETYGPITDSSENLIWFLQISDIHISIFRDPGRISQFQQFCENTVRKIRPSVVLATGDLTDAKAKDNLGSSQVKLEWVYYFNIIKESGVTDETLWLDIRGNHDNFNIKSIHAQENYYRNFSVQGQQNPRSYLHIVDENNVKVAFLGVDACPDPGVRRPFNFIGVIDHQEQQYIQKLKEEADSKADHVIWFGHYPTSCILSVKKDSKKLDLRQLIGSSSGSQAYMCGHLHTMGGIVPKMYTKQKTGFLELELGDWKDNRQFRLAAIDHGIFSFVDQQHNSWPLVLITNPKHAQYTVPYREPLQLMSNSTHIRILAFSDVQVERVKYSFDKVTWMDCANKKGPLFTCKWLPHLFTKGLHYLYVHAVDEIGKEALIEHPFSLDGTQIGFKITPRILLMLDAGTVVRIFQSLYGTLLLINVLPLVILKTKKSAPKYRRKLFNFVLRRLWLLSKVDRLFYPIVLYVVYISVGPWAIGEFIDGHIGIIFAWGIIIKSTFLPEPFTYMYGSVQLVFIHIPLTLVLAHTLGDRVLTHNPRGLKKLFKHFPFIVLLSMQLLLAYFFWLEYGTLAFMFGPLRTWSVALSLLLWYKTLTLPPDYCRKLMKMCNVS